MSRKIIGDAVDVSEANTLDSNVLLAAYRSLTHVHTPRWETQNLQKYTGPCLAAACTHFILITQDSHTSHAKNVHRNLLVFLFHMQTDFMQNCIDYSDACK